MWSCQALPRDTSAFAHFAMSTHARAPAVAAVTPLAIMLADARAPAVLALAPLAVMRANAGAPAVLALAPLAVMLADACAPAVLAVAPAAVMWQRGFTPHRLAIPHEGHAKGINQARADALLPSSAKGRHALSSMALGDLFFRVSSSLTPSRVIPMDPSHK